MEHSDIDEIACGMDAFPAYIYKFRFDFKWDSIKDKVKIYLDETQKLKEEKNLTDPEQGGGVSSVHWNYSEKYGEHTYGLPKDWDEFKEYYSTMNYIQNLLCEKWGYNPKWDRLISESWMNRHPKGAWTAEHHHQNTMFATTAYLNMPENGGHFMIKNPLLEMKKAEPTDQAYWNEEKYWAPVEVETNDVLVFPGWLTHKTQVNESDEDRYILSTNYTTMRRLHDYLDVISGKHWV